MGRSGKLLKALLAAVRALKPPTKRNGSHKKSNAGRRPKKAAKEKCLWTLGRHSTRKRESLSSSASVLDTPEIKSIHVEDSNVKDVLLSSGSVTSGSLHASRSLDSTEEKSIIGIGAPAVVKDVEQEEIAVIKIQAAIRRYLTVQRICRSVRALVRIQAVVRGRIVRKRAATSLRCMQAIVRVQALARGYRIRSSELGHLIQEHIRQTREQRSISEGAGRINSIDALQQMQENAQIRQDLDLKRRCALVYAFSQELNKCTEKQKSLSSLNFQPDRRNWIWVWLERWMATKYMGKTQHGVGKQQQSVISETQQRNKNASLCAKVLETDRSGSQLESAGDKHPVFIGPEIISEDVTGAAHQFEEGRFIIEDREIQCETEETKDVETICEVQDEVVEQAIKDKETTSIIVGGETTSRGVQKCAEEGNGVEDSCLVRNAETERGDVDFVLESSALGDDELEFSDDFVKKSVDAKLLPKQSSSSSPRSPVSTTTFQNAQATTPSPPVPPPSSSSSDWSSAAGPMLQNSELTIQAPLLSPPLIQSMEESESCTAERRKELSIINNNYPSTDVLDSASCLAERFSNANTPTVHTTLGTSAPSDFEDATSAFPCPITEQVNVFCPSGTLKNISDSPTAVNEISLGSSSIPEGDGNMHHKYANSTSMSDFRLQSSLPSHVSSPEVLPSAIQRHTLCTPLVIPNVTNEDMLDVAEEEMVDESHQQLTSMDSMLSVADGVVSCGADLYLDQSSVNADGGEIEELALRSDAPFNVLTANESVQNLSNSDQPDEGNDLRTDEASQDLSRSDDRINVLRTDRTVQNDPSTEVNGTSDTLGSSGNDHMKEMLTDNHLTSSPIMHGRQKEAVSPSIPNYMNTTQSSKAKMRSPSLKSEFPKLKSASPKPKFDLSKVKADSSHTKTDVTPKRRHDSPKQMLDSPKLRLESPKQRLDSPNRRLESPKQRLESPKQRFESPKQRLESPKQKHDYAKYKVDSDTTQKAETLVKRRHSFPGAEVKGSLGSNKPLMHVRATNKGNQSALLRGETGMEDLPRSNGHPRSRMEK